MVRVWYEPPPYGYGTDLMNAPYGVHGAGAYKSVRNLVERLSRMKQSYVMIPSVALICALCYIPSMNDPLPYSFDPEYQAASRAFQRYHNMDPIFGISSKKERPMTRDP